MTTLTERIAEVVAATGLNQTEIGARINVSRPAVSQWLSGDSKRLRMEHLFALADLSGYEPRWIALGVGPKRRADRINHNALRLLACYEQADKRGREWILKTAEREANYTP